MTKYISRAAIAAAALALGISGAYAGPYSNNAQLDVAVTVIEACTINSVGAITFANVVPGVTSIQDDKTSTINVTCSAPAFSITADTGLNANSNDAGTRQMVSADLSHAPLQYHLYLSDSHFVTEWGSPANHGQPIPGTGGPLPQNYTIDARMPAQPVSGATGTYRDTVTVVITN